MDRWVQGYIGRIEAAGVHVLYVIEVRGKDPVFVTNENGINRLIDLYGSGNYQGLDFNYIAPLNGGGYIDASTSECFVQQSDTFIGILHDIWCSDVDWWDGENSIAEVDEFVKTHGIPDDLGHYQMVMDCITNDTQPPQYGLKNIRTSARSGKKKPAKKTATKAKPKGKR